MFARLTTARISPDRIDEFVKRYKESVIPAAKQQKGYQGARIFVERKTGNGMVITFWESEEDAVANEENRYYQEQVAKFITFFKKPPIREGYEVVFQD
ncbi:MAG: antibiotic biosynthesis monooxygenase [Candidatus Aminicenantes bacterium]